MATWVRRLLIVEDDPLMRALLAELLADRSFEVAAAAAVDAAVHQLEDFDPDVVLIDIDLGPGPSGSDLAFLVAHKYPQVALVFLTKHPDARTAGIPLDALPEHYAFLRKDLIDDVSALDAALEGALREMPELPRHDQAGSPLSRLTDDQFSVLRMVAEGWTNSAIAAARGTSERSVERLLQASFETLGLPESGEINRRVDAVRIFITHAGVPSRKPTPP